MAKDSDKIIQVDLALFLKDTHGRELRLDYDPANPQDRQEAERVRQEFLAQSPPTAKKAQGELLSILIPKFLEEMKRTRAAATFGKFEHSLRTFIDLTGDCGIYELGQARLAMFRDKLLILPKHIGVKAETRDRPVTELAESSVENTIAPRTVNTHLVNVVAFSSWAHARDEKVPKLTAEKLALPIDRRPDEERKAFDENDLRLLFEGPAYKALASREPHKCWLMLIAIYTGARIEEICQLDLNTDVEVLEGVPVLDINDSDLKRVKNKASRRKVPVSPKLVELGLMDYLESMKRQGHQRPFPQWDSYTNKKTGEVKHSKNASKWFGRYCDQLGISDPGKVFHSFRHTLLNYLKQSGIDEGKAAALAGQTYGGITYARYGKAYQPADLYEVVKGIDLGISPIRPMSPN